MDERLGKPGMPEDSQLMRNARAAAVVVNEYEQRAVAGGPAVPDGAYLNLAKMTELLSRVRPDHTGAVNLVAAEAAVYYIKAGSYDAAYRITLATLPFVEEGSGLFEYLNELNAEARTGIMNGGSRMEDPFSIEKQTLRNDGFVPALSARVLAEESEIIAIERVIDKMPTPKDAPVEVIRLNEPVGMIPEPTGIGRSKRSETVVRVGSEVLKSLTPSQRETLEVYISSGRASSKEVAQRLGITINALNVRFHFISRKFGVIGREDAADSYLRILKSPEQLVEFTQKPSGKDDKDKRRRSQKVKYTPRMEREVLYGIAVGSSDKDVSVNAKISVGKVKAVRSALMRKYKVENPVDIIFNLLRKKSINLSSLLPKDFNPDSFGDPTDMEAIVLGKYVNSMGLDSDQEIADSLGLTTVEVSRLIKDVQFQLGAKNRLQLLIRALASKEMGYELITDDETIIFSSS